MSLIEYEEEERAMLTPLLEPPSSDASAQLAHSEMLRAHGFVVVWDASHVKIARALGVMLARTSTDGALWPMARAADPKGFAHWAHSADLEVVKYVAQFLAKPPGTLTDDTLEYVAAAAFRIKRTPGRTSPVTTEHLTMLDSMLRLGASGAEILRYLEQIK